MNIFVYTSDGLAYTRPDTSLNRKSEDYYPPEYIQSLAFTPVLYTRISNAVKCVSSRFAGRYYELAGFGMLLYAPGIEGPAGFAAGACLDGTSRLLDLPLVACTLPGSFSIKCTPIVSGLATSQSLETANTEAGTGNTEAETTPKGTELKFQTCVIGPELLEKGLVAASRSCLLKRGDLLCTELSPLLPLCSKQEAKEFEIQVLSNNSIIQDFKIIFV